MRSLVRLAAPKLATQMLVPSKAIPLGKLPPQRCLAGPPLFARNFVTLLLIRVELKCSLKSLFSSRPIPIVIEPNESQGRVSFCNRVVDFQSLGRGRLCFRHCLARRQDCNPESAEEVVGISRPDISQSETWICLNRLSENTRCFGLAPLPSACSKSSVLSGKPGRPPRSSYHV